MIFGVAGGLASYFDVDPVLTRVAFVILTFAGGSGLLLYIVLAIIMPPEDATARDTTREDVEENLSRLGTEASALGERFSERVRAASDQPTDASKNRTYLFGVILVLLGLLFLLENLGVLSWFRWSLFWPVVLILIGFALLAGRFRRS